MAAIVLGSVWAYGTSFKGVFVFDDLPTIVENPALRHGWPWLAGAAGRENTLTVGGRPVVNLTLGLNYALSGTAVWSYHAVNLLIHTLAGLALFGIVRRTLLRLGTYPGAETGLACFAALLWAVHPLQTEAVTYIVQRTESLMGLFYFLTLYCFIRGVERPVVNRSETLARSATPIGSGSERSGNRKVFVNRSETLTRSATWGMLSVFFCLLGMASKEVMVTAPVIVFLYDRTFVSGSFRAAWRGRRTFYLCLAATWLVLALLVASTGGTRGGTAGFGVGLTPWTYGLTQAKAIPHYLRLVFWPHPLVFDYGTQVISDVRAALLPGLLIGLLLAGTLVALIRRLPLGFLGAWFFLTLAPSSSFVPVATQTMAEHRMYLALAPIAAWFVLGLHRALRRRTWLAVAGLALALSVATRQRNDAYRSLATLWGDAAAAYPANDRAHYNFGLALLHAQRASEGMAELRDALRLNPGNAEAHNALGDALCQSGRVAEGMSHLETALGLKPDFAEAQNNLGKALCETGRPAEGIPHLEAALRANPRLLAARNNLANALLASGRTAEAMEQSRAALGVDADSAQAHCSLGNELLHAGRPAEAVFELSTALRLKPDFAEAHNDLGCALVALPGREPEARAEWEAALRIDPAQADAHNNLGMLLAKAGGTVEAVPHFIAALRLKPDFAEAHSNLGITYAQSGRMPEAALHFAEAVRLKPDDVGSRKNLARALVELGRLPEATAQFEQLVRLVPNDAELRRNLSDLRRAGRFDLK